MAEDRVRMMWSLSGRPDAKQLVSALERCRRDITAIE